MLKFKPLKWSCKRSLREKEKSLSKNLIKNLRENAKKNFGNTSLRCHVLKTKKMISLSRTNNSLRSKSEILRDQPLTITVIALSRTTQIMNKGKISLRQE